MGLLALFKLLFFVLWPAFLLIPFYFHDKEQFKHQLREMLKNAKSGSSE